MATGSWSRFLEYAALDRALVLFARRAAGRWRTMTLGSTEVSLLKGWLVLIGLFEVPNLYNFLLKNADLDGFFSTLNNDRPEKRSWCLVLALLMLSRFQTAADIRNKTTSVCLCSDATQSLPQNARPL